MLHIYELFFEESYTNEQRSRRDRDRRARIIKNSIVIVNLFISICICLFNSLFVCLFVYEFEAIS